MDEEKESEILNHLTVFRNAKRNFYKVFLVAPQIIWLFADLTTAAIVSGLGVAFGIWLYVGSLAEPRDHPILVALRDKPETILQAYLLSVNGGLDTVAMIVEGGTRLNVPTNDGQQREYLQMIAEVAPHAKIGHVPGEFFRTREEVAAFKQKETEEK